MKGRLVGMAVALALLGTVPAHALISVGPHVGTLTGTGVIGKEIWCRNYGLGQVQRGGGLGYVPTPAKNVSYLLTASVVDAPNGLGTLFLCGHLTAPLQNTPLDIKALGIGASCMAHKGWDGKGTFQFPSKPTAWKWVSNLGWKTSVGGTLAVNADVGGVKGKKIDLLLGVWQMDHEPTSCAIKDAGDKTTMGRFRVAGAYVIIPLAGGQTPKKPPKKPKVQG